MTKRTLKSILWLMAFLYLSIPLQAQTYRNSRGFLVDNSGYLVAVSALDPSFNGQSFINSSGLAVDNTGRIIISSSSSVGSFPLTSTTANPAQSGQLRLANNTDKICWRNALNTADLCIYIDSSNVFQIPGSFAFAGNILTLGSTGQTGSASQLLGYGGTSPTSGFAIEGGDNSLTNPSYLYFDPTASGTICVNTTASSGACTVANAVVYKADGYFTNNPAGSTPTSAAGSAVAQNAMKLEPFYLPNKIVLSNLSYYVQTADNSANVYDIGAYGPGCFNATASVPLAYHIGPTAGTVVAPSTGVKSIAISGGPISLLPGWYCYAYTSSASSPALVFGGNTTTSNWVPFGLNSAGSTTSSGTLNPTQNAPSLSWQLQGSVYMTIY